MAKFANKPTHRSSKRQTSKLKNNIDKRVKEHNRKMKKEAKQLKAIGVIKKSKKHKARGGMCVRALFVDDLLVL